MKKYFLAIIASVFIINANAQQVERKVSKRKVKEYVYPSNIIKLNLTGLIFKTVGIQYEYKLANNLSLGLGVTYRPKSNFLLYESYGQNPTTYGMSLETGYMFSTANYGRFAFTPELRYYFKKKAPKGLYLAPFLKYQRESTAFDFKYTESNTIVSTNKIGKGLLTDTRMGVGLLFGYQVVKTNKLAIDFWFLGPWFGQSTSKLNSKINMTNVTAADQSILASSMEPFYYNQGIKWDGNGINTTYKKYGGGVRMLGINIGYNF